MAMTVEDMAAHLEIQQVLYRYCRGVDRGDKAMLASVYHEEAIDTHGGWVGKGRDFSDYLVPAMDAVPLVGQHHITNMLIEVHGDRADVESYYIAYHPEGDGEGGGRLARVCGRYLDKFERRDGAWKIADRKVLIDLSEAPSDTGAWSRASGFPGGGRREADPSYDHFTG